MDILLDKVVTDIDGKPDKSSGKEMTMGELLGKNLVMSASHDPIRNREWGLTLYSNKTLSLKPSECEELQKFCKEMGVSDLYKGQILAELNSQFDNQNKK